MIDIRSYLVRAWREWILDNQLTPYIVVDCQFSGVLLPESFHKQDNITLDINPSALKKFELTQDYICFEARFNQQFFHIHIPILAVHGIYAQENNHGMWFDIEKNAKAKHIKTQKKEKEFILSD